MKGPRHREVKQYANGYIARGFKAGWKLKYSYISTDVQIYRTTYISRHIRVDGSSLMQELGERLETVNKGKTDWKVFLLRQYSQIYFGYIWNVSPTG